MRSSDWISDVGSSDLLDLAKQSHGQSESHPDSLGQGKKSQGFQKDSKSDSEAPKFAFWTRFCALTHDPRIPSSRHPRPPSRRSEEHTSELQSLMRISYAVFCLKKKKH